MPSLIRQYFFRKATSLNFSKEGTLKDYFFEKENLWMQQSLD
jgi:hypothetical protein